MGHIEATANFAATPEAVWKTVSDPTTWGEWFTIHDRWIDAPPTELTTGTRLTAKVVMLGMANKIEWTVGEVNKGVRLELEGTGMAGVKTTFGFSIEPNGSGTTFSVAGDFEGAMIKGALGKAVEKDGKKQLDKTLEQLDRLASVES